MGLIPRWGRSLGGRRKWQPTPVFLPGKSHGQRSLAGYSPWGCKRVGPNLHNINASEKRDSGFSMPLSAPPLLLYSVFSSLLGKCTHMSKQSLISVCWGRSEITSEKILAQTRSAGWALSASLPGVVMILGLQDSFFLILDCPEESSKTPASFGEVTLPVSSISYKALFPDPSRDGRWGRNSKVDQDPSFPHTGWPQGTMLSLSEPYLLRKLKMTLPFLQDFLCVSLFIFPQSPGWETLVKLLQEFLLNQG